MIKEEDAAKHVGLPPEQRFYLVERLARERVAEARREAGSHDFPAYDDHDYMIEVMAAAEAFGIAELGRWELPSLSNDDWQATCRNFRAEATKVSQRLMFKYAGVPNPDPNTVAFDAATKQKLRFHLEQVRGIVDADPMADWRKQELYKAIAALEREIEKARTHVTAVFDVLAKLWDGEVRAADAIRQVIMIVQEARAKEQEKAKLLAPVEPKQIEAQKQKKLPAPPGKRNSNGYGGSLDDEIPF